MRALLLLLTACWGTGQSAAPAAQPMPSPEPVASSSSLRPRAPASACHRVVDRLAQRFRADVAVSGVPEATIDEMIDAAVESCRVMEWSSELLYCLESVADQNDLAQCQASLTQDQTEDLTRRMMEVVSRMNQVTPPPPPP